MRQYSAIFVGGGNRAIKMATTMHSMPEQYRVLAVAEPMPERKQVFREFGVAEENIVDDWQELLARPKMADVAVIATQDNMHYEPALKAIEQGYDILLEKPVAQTAQECADIARAAREKGVKVLVCHVLRYTPFYGKIKELLMAGTIGEVVSVDMVEGIGHTHYAHSYVRGPWKSEKEATPMLVAKSCHDMDMVQWLVDRACTRVQSFGSLTHFTRANMPAGAPKRCLEGCPVGDTCPYNSVRFYYEDPKCSWRRLTTKGIAKEFWPTDDEVMQALKTTDFGLCVYQANNDVCDHQVVNLEFEGGVTATFSVNAFNRGGRYVRIYGTKGELFAHAADTEIQLFTFEDNRRWTVEVPKIDETIFGGHGGGDDGIIRELYEYLSDSYAGFRAADIDASVENHFIAFAAEQSRREGTVVNVEKMLRQYNM